MSWAKQCKPDIQKFITAQVYVVYIWSLYFVAGPRSREASLRVHHESQSSTIIRITTTGELVPRYPWFCAARLLGSVLLSGYEAADDTTSRSSCSSQSLRLLADWILRSHVEDYTIIRASPITIHITDT